AWGSRSMVRTRRPRSASAAATFRVLVVLAVPPFWLKKAMTRVIRVVFAPVACGQSGDVEVPGGHRRRPHHTGVAPGRASRGRDSGGFRLRFGSRSLAPTEADQKRVGNVAIDDESDADHEPANDGVHPVMIAGDDD